MSFLRNCRVAVFGDFGPGKSIEAIARWIKFGGGVLERTVSTETTHIICHEEEWKKKTSRVRAAQIGFRKAEIVTFDWLEDSLNKKRALVTRPYSLHHLQAAAKRKERQLKAKEQAKKSFVKGASSQADEDLCGAAFHTYKDPMDNFEYSVRLRRLDVEKKKVENYQLSLYESNAKPHLYATAIRLYRPGVSKSQVLAPIGSLFPQAFEQFKKFFLKKTGISWDDRCAEDVELPTDEESLFKYTPPVLGRPRGTLRSEQEAKVFEKEISAKIKRDRLEAAEEAERMAVEMERAEREQKRLAVEARIEEQRQKKLAKQIADQEWVDPQAEGKYRG